MSVDPHKGTWFFLGPDAPFADELIFKGGSMGRFEDRLEYEDPKTWWDWDPSGRSFTCDANGWRAHFSPGWPLTFYHDERFVFGLYKPFEDSRIKVDQVAADTVWARIGRTRIVMERGDFPRFTTSGYADFSHHLRPYGDYPNVFHIGNGYVVACARKPQILQMGARTSDQAWWMLAPIEEAHEVSRRVLVLKIYDGPYSYQARGTDIRLADPVPISSVSEYAIHSYDDDGMRGIYKETYQGVAPQKKAIVLRGNDLLNFTQKTGDIRTRNEQVVGSGTVRYSLPLHATKLLNIYTRGSEVDVFINPDDSGWVTWENYDGLATNELELEARVFNSLSSIRIEYESLRSWTPVGRPLVDIIRSEHRADDPTGTANINTQRNEVRVRGRDGEGLAQIASLPTGRYTVSADVRCFRGEAAIDVGGIEMVTWQPLDKTLRGSDDFTVNTGDYEVLITGTASPDEGTFAYEIDDFLLAEGGQKNWLENDIEWYVESEEGEYPASASINDDGVPVALGEAKRWRIGIRVPEDIGIHEQIPINAIRAERLKTGEDHLVRHIKWSGVGPSRVYYPDELVFAPVPTPHISTIGDGAVTWQMTSPVTTGDVRVLIDGIPLAYRAEELTYRTIELANERWRVWIGEDFSLVYLDGVEIGRMGGQGLPLQVAHENSEDITIDAPEGVVQLRRGMGPRFEGWSLDRAAGAFTVTEGSITAWGDTPEQAVENVPHYRVEIAR